MSGHVIFKARPGMTRQDVERGLLEAIDRVMADNRRKFISDLLLAGVGDEDIEATLATADEMVDDARPTLIADVKRLLNEAVRQ